MELDHLRVVPLAWLTDEVILPPGEYYLAVWAPYNWLPVPADATDTMPRVFEVRAGDRLDVGRLEVAWP